MSESRRGREKYFSRRKAGATTDAEPCHYAAKYVVFTPLIGVLKHGVDNSMFVPALPSTKIDLIRALRIGVVNKVWIRFDRPFWV